MFKKSFAEMLKENLGEESFKPPTPPPPIRFIKKETSFLSTDPFLLEIKRHYLTVKDVEKIYGSRSFHKKLFKEPVKMVFYWCEEDWQGSLFVVYSYKNKYIYINGGFGSCEVCDRFPQSEESLIKTFQSLNVSDSIENISFSTYAHPELLKHFDKFKLKVSKQYQKTPQNPTQKTTPQIINQNKEIKIVDTLTPQPDFQPKIQKRKISSWASLFK
jgi:hypothetical protein